MEPAPHSPTPTVPKQSTPWTSTLICTYTVLGNQPTPPGLHPWPPPHPLPLTSRTANAGSPQTMGAPASMLIPTKSLPCPTFPTTTSPPTYLSSFLMTSEACSSKLVCYKGSSLHGTAAHGIPSSVTTYPFTPSSTLSLPEPFFTLLPRYQECERPGVFLSLTHYIMLPRSVIIGAFMLTFLTHLSSLQTVTKHYYTLVYLQSHSIMLGL